MHDRRRRPLRTVFGLAAVVGLTLTMLTPLTTSGSATFAITMGKVATGFAAPTQVTSARDGSGRLFVVEARGTVRVVKDGKVQSGYFMDIRNKVAAGGERGLLGLAFHPNFVNNHRLYVYYTRPGGDIVVSRFVTNSAGTNVNESTARPLLLIEHSSQTNHNGGSMAFGPDGYLYIGVGDGGGAGDPNRRGQSKQTMLGKILRINPGASGSGRFNAYAIPDSNPFAGATSGLDEIWAYGLRNPWRFSFDRGTGDLFIGDVGQGKYEEIDRQLAGSAGGQNYGWNVMEGLHCYTPSKCPLAGDTLPIREYTHSGGNCSITGGYVYRGPTYPDMQGLYVFADFCSGKFWTINPDGSNLVLRADIAGHPTSFGESDDGLLYVVTQAGGLYQVRASG